MAGYETGEQWNRTLEQAKNLERFDANTRLERADSLDQPAGRWVDRGIVDVPVQALPRPEGVEGPLDFKKTSAAEMRAGFQNLETMRPFIASGEGNNSDYWYHVDRQHNVDAGSGYQEVYDAFYGDDAIRLNKIGDQYEIVNGRHRIWIAQESGIPTVPAKVIEKM